MQIRVLLDGLDFLLPWNHCHGYLAPIVGLASYLNLLKSNNIIVIVTAQLCGLNAKWSRVVIGRALCRLCNRLDRWM